MAGESGRMRRGLLNSKMTAQERDSWNRSVLKDGRRRKAWGREVVTRRKEIEKADGRMSGAPFPEYAQHSFVWVTK